MNTTLKKLHADWAAKVLPKDAGPIQRQECERSFYSGAFALFTLTIAEIAAKPDDKAEEQMSAIESELKDYFRLLRNMPGPEGTQRQ